MHKLGRLIIGGIESKIFNLVLINLVIVIAAFALVLNHSANDLTQLVADANVKQEESMRNTTNATMEAVVTNTMGQTVAMEAYIADDLFEHLKSLVQMLGDYTKVLLESPENYPQNIRIRVPDKNDDGKAVPQLLYGENVDMEAPANRLKVKLLGNLSDMMVSLYNTNSINSCFVSVPEGFTIITDDRSATKFNDDGTPVMIDGTTRSWYKNTAAKGEIYFSDIEIDAFTRKKGMVCAVPIYVNGRLEAIVGADLFLDAIENEIDAVSDNGGITFIVNQDGHVIFSSDKEGFFKVNVSSEAENLKENENGELAAFISGALTGDAAIKQVDIGDKSYYMAGSAMPAVGWALVSAVDKSVLETPANMLIESNNAILEDSKTVYEYNISKSKLMILIILVVIFLLGILNAVVLSKRIVKPLNSMASRISELSGDDLAFRMEDKYRTGDEIQVLAENFEALSLKTLNYINEITRITAEKERIGAELNVATQIQADMLPRIFPPFPDRKEFDLFASMNPAKEVGGDFYDYFLVDDDHIALIMADVSGKGVPAALFMVITKTLIKNRAQMGGSVSEILKEVNDQLCEGNEAEMFVTVWMAIIEISTGKGIAANAGHEHPAIRHRDGEFELVEYRHSPALAVMEGIPFRQHEFTLNPGDTVFVYTDGVAEATDANNELFGNERMLKGLNREPDAEPKKVLENVMDSIEDFVEDAPQFDDITMLCFKYYGKGQAEH